MEIFPISTLYWSGFGISSRNRENPDEIAVAGQCYKQLVHCVDPLYLIDVNQNSRSVSCRTVRDITIDHSSVYQIEVTVIQVHLLSIGLLFSNFSGNRGGMYRYL